MPLASCSPYFRFTSYRPGGTSGAMATAVEAPAELPKTGGDPFSLALAGLLGGEPGPPIPEDEYDRLYVLTRRPGIGTTTVVLRLERSTSRIRPW